MRVVSKLLPVLLLAVWLGGCAETPADRETLYQVSTIQSLLVGNYDGCATVGELMRHGDVGLGTFDKLEGEMIVVDGICYQVKVDGKAVVVADDEGTPFAAVTFFDSDRSFEVKDVSSFRALQDLIDKELPTLNMPYAVRIKGKFRYLKARSVPGQEKPYPPLVEVVKKQAIFEFHNVEGVIVALRLPAYLKGINAAGHHHHFITANRTAGGHVLGLIVAQAVVEIDMTPALHLVLPQGKGFFASDLARDRKRELDKVEGAAH